jgi:hypothetical protein
MSPRFYPLASLSVLSLVGVVLLPFAAFGARVGLLEVVSVFAMAAPFMVLVAGHTRVPQTWKYHWLLVLANLPLLVGWWLARLASWYFRTGWLGGAFLGVCLCIPVAFLVARLSRPQANEKDFAAPQG